MGRMTMAILIVLSALGHAAAAGEFLGSVAPAVSSETAPAAPLLEEPHAEQEASPMPSQEGWDNDTSLDAALQHWGVSFCRVHRVGYFCNGYSLVKCCRTWGGYGMCGSTVHSNRCGWRAGGAGVWHAGRWHAGGWRLDQITEQDQPEDAPLDAVVEVPSAEHEAPTGVPADVFPDETTGFDSLGPFDEVPSPEQEANPAPAKMEWENETELQAAAFNTWGQSFCRVHHVGTFCDGYTQVRCCRTSWGFEKCGSTVHSSRCGWNGGSVNGGWNGGSVNGGWNGGSVNGGSAWHIHPGWRQSSFCRAHHTGYFCFSHRKVHCCNDHGHYVDCTTRSQTY